MRRRSGFAKSWRPAKASGWTSFRFDPATPIRAKWICRRTFCKDKAMPIIESLHFAPVKSLALRSAESAFVTSRGIENDRRFVILDESGRAVTQRRIGALARVSAEYSPETDALTMTFPDGETASGRAELGGETATVLWGRVARGRVVVGDWSAALSDFCGERLTLMKTDAPGACFDEYPVSLISRETIDRLSAMTDGAKTFEAARFRPTLLISGCAAREEDSWLGKGLLIGERLRLRLIARDPRCAITTLDPKTGERDFDTLRLILSYRPDPRAAYLGVYGIVELPGTVAVGDEVSVTR